MRGSEHCENVGSCVPTASPSQLALQTYNTNLRHRVRCTISEPATKISQRQGHWSLSRTSREKKQHVVGPSRDLRPFSQVILSSRNRLLALYETAGRSLRMSEDKPASEDPHSTTARGCSMSVLQHHRINNVETRLRRRSPPKSLNRAVDPAKKIGVENILRVYRQTTRSGCATCWFL